MATYRYWEESGFEEKFTADGDKAAGEYARESLLSGDWNQAGADKSFRVRAEVGQVVTEPDGTEDIIGRRDVIVTIDPIEPKCTGSEHDWQSPYELVGGIHENPGVWGNGGGVIIDEACVTCGAGRKTDTWATDPSNGEPFTAVSYEPAGRYDVAAVS